MKVSKREMQILKKHFKELVRMDVNGITASDARRTVATWLHEIGQSELADAFEDDILAYQDSPAVRKMEME